MFDATNAPARAAASVHNRLDVGCRHAQVERLHTRHERATLLLRCMASNVTHFMHRKLRIALIVLACGVALQTTAQDIEQLETELIAEVKVDVSSSDARARARYVPATIVSQGQVVYYTVRIRNSSPEYARDVVVVQRIPANTVYVAESAVAPGADVSFSLDGGYSFAASAELLTVDGSGMERLASVEQYTHIRWQLRNALAPGAIALARFRAVFQ
jgi:uncharacterized repeat protein (TIGR01451 family)